MIEYIVTKLDSAFGGNHEDIHMGFQRQRHGLYLGEIAYAITHKVFHLSDFRFSSLKDSDVVTYLNRWIPHYLSKLNSLPNARISGTAACFAQS